MSAIQVSIIIPVHERYLFLKECIQSVVDQTIENKEIICILDGECEASRLIIEEVANGEVTIITKKKEGAWAARNLGLELAQGEYVCFMDSDDYYPSTGSIEKLYVAAKKNNALICGGNINNVYENKVVSSRGDVFLENGFVHNEDRPQMYGHTRYLYKRDFLLDNCLKNERLRRFEDPPFVLRTFVKAKQYYTIKDVIYNCRSYERDDFYDYETLVDILKGINICAETLKKVPYNINYKQYIYGAIESIYSQVICYLDLDNEIIHHLVERVKRDLTELSFGEVIFLDVSQAKEVVKSKKELLEKIRQSSRLSIYGAGNVAKKVISSEIIDQSKIKKCYVSKITKGQDSINEIKISCINDIDKFSNDLVIVAADGNNAEEMMLVLKQMEYDNHCLMGSLDIQILCQLKRMNALGEFDEVEADKK